MRHRAGKWLAVLMLASLFLGACGPELPSGVHVNILKLQHRQVTLEQLQAAFEGADVAPPLFEQTPGTSLYVIVVPFDIPWINSGVNFRLVRINLFSWREAGGGFEENPNVRLVMPIPQRENRSSNVTESTKFAVNVTATIKALSGTGSAETTSSESYEKIYRSVTGHLQNDYEATWEFEPFMDEAIPGGLHYVALVVEVPTGSSGNLFYASSGCYYSADAVMGMEGEGSGCTAGDTQWLELP